MKVLLVEDDQVTREYILSGLKEGGHAVDDAADGVDGLALALRGNYDAVILDRMLPGMDGLSILKAMRAAKITTPVIFLTARGKPVGVGTFLASPYRTNNGRCGDCKGSLR